MGDRYILGLNAYDHDASACLLRNGEIAVAVSKERVTRVKHASGFHQETIGYCLDAAGITLDEVDLIVANCYILPIPEFERRLVYHHEPTHLPMGDRERAAESPLFLGRDPRVKTCSHHLAHAYSAFACSPFDEGSAHTARTYSSRSPRPTRRIRWRASRSPTTRSPDARSRPSRRSGWGRARGS